MNLFSCQHCGQLVYFENIRCERCGYALGYQLDTNRIVALESVGDGSWRSEDGVAARYCANVAHGVCNWLVPPDASPDALCESCGLNRTIPDLSVATNLESWRRLELAKHRLVYSLQRLGLPIVSGHAYQGGLLFDFLSGHGQAGESQPVTTGHANGVVTIDLSEADPAVRTQRRQGLGERFRTLLGHFRHEAAHYYFTHLISEGAHQGPGPSCDSFRDAFGDESRDYGAALDTYYAQGPRSDWNQSFVSAYASSHPHEDWAETFAHYIHIVDTLDSARAFGIRAKPEVTDELTLDARFDAYTERDFDRLWATWLPLTFAMNELNRSVGNDDLYPFVLSRTAVEKLRFVHRTIKGY